MGRPPIRRASRTDPGTPEKCNIYTLHKFFSDEAKQAAVHAGCTTAGIGCIDCKKMLFEGMKTELDRFASAPTPCGRIGRGSM